MPRKPLQIFRVGTHTPMAGAPIAFDEAMLRACVEAYDPAIHEAPIVVGHPKTDDPAYAWVRSLRFADGVIEAEPYQIDPQFSELVEQGRYKKISAAFYMPDAPTNPKPGVLYLRHVGFLGAQPPSVKGLKSASFADREEGVIEFGEWADSQNASLWRRMREFLIEKFSRDDADKTLPEWEVKSLEEAARSDSKSVYAESQEPGTMLTAAQIEAKEQELASRERKLQADEAAFAERQTVLTTQQRAQQRIAHVAFADSLISSGRLLPAHKDGVVAFMAQLSETGVVEFGEGANKTQVPSLDWFKAFLGAQPKVVTFGEHARPDDETVDTENAEDIAKAAVEFQEAEAKAGRVIDAAGAVQHVMKRATK